MMHGLKTPLKTTLAGLAVVTALSGCAAPAAVGSVAALADMATGVSVVSTALTGKGTSELAMDAATGKDCRFEGLYRDDRQLCEDVGSPATDKDFKGLIGMYKEGGSPDTKGDMEPGQDDDVALDGAPTEGGQDNDVALAATAPDSGIAPDEMGLDGAVSDEPPIAEEPPAAEMPRTVEATARPRPEPQLEPGKRSAEPYYRFLPTY